ncbi:MAG TPA: LptA/OstA family protein [Myxococcota bacterium]|nr:LptA/OstA family protein [Myxococcota bacterium]
MAIAVASFEGAAPAGSEVPDVSSLLADRLATKGVGQVVGPQALGVDAKTDPSADDVKAWAAKAGVEAVVVGRTTRTGPELAIELHLRSGATGQVVASYAAQVPQPEALPGAIDRLSDEVITGWRKARPPAAPVAKNGAPPGAAARGAGPGATGEAKSGFQSTAPISIKSDELEAIQKAKERFFLFTGHVFVQQDNVTLHSDRLEAYYPEGSSQPERLVATGHVVIEQEGKTAICDQATYLNTAQRIFCRGSAELRQGQDTARGKEIELQLDTERMFIRGDALVVLKPKEKEKAPAPAPPLTLGPGGA